MKMNLNKWAYCGVFILSIIFLQNCNNLKSKKTVLQVQNELEGHIQPIFDQYKTKHPFPIDSIILIAIKDEKIMEMWFQHELQKTKIKTYPIMAASGHAGPKLKEGDRQVPEGIYKIESLNPNSMYHLSMKINYPNDFDQKMAKLESRTDLGFDIFIHGKEKSVGCLAMGDEAIEELFYIISKIGKEKAKIIISPIDLRKYPIPDVPSSGWVMDLYHQLYDVLVMYR